MLPTVSSELIWNKCVQYPVLQALRSHVLGQSCGAQRAEGYLVTLIHSHRASSVYFVHGCITYQIPGSRCQAGSCMKDSEEVHHLCSDVASAGRAVAASGM